MMFHDPYGDNLRFTTNELICALTARIDGPNCLFALLALTIEVSDTLPVDRQWCMAQSLADASRMIEQRAAVRAWTDRLGLTPAYNGERATPA